jgi:hypothetical protein
MKLKEFELWVFKLSNKESSDLTMFSRSVYSHFERHFEPFETGEKFYRIILKLAENDRRIGSVELGSFVLYYYLKFDFLMFGTLKESEKKETLLELMYRSVLKLAEIYSWDTEPFANAYNAVKNESYINHYTHKEKWNSSRDLCAKIWCEHEASIFRCSLIVENKDKDIIMSTVLFTEKPDEFFFNNRLGNIKWLDRRKLQFFTKKESQEFNVIL